jgi:flagellar protein FlaG
MSLGPNPDVLAVLPIATTAAANAGGTRPPAVAEPQPSRPEPRPSAPSQVDAYLRAHNQSVRFQVDQVTGLTIVHVVDATTGKVVRQIPSEVVVRVAQYLHSQGNSDRSNVDVTA